MRVRNLSAAGGTANMRTSHLALSLCVRTSTRQELEPNTGRRAFVLNLHLEARNRNFERHLQSAELWVCGLHRCQRGGTEASQSLAGKTGIMITEQQAPAWNPSRDTRGRLQGFKDKHRCRVDDMRPTDGGSFASSRSRDAKPGQCKRSCVSFKKPIPPCPQ